jgi:hypothetical protein
MAADEATVGLSDLRLQDSDKKHRRKKEYIKGFKKYKQNTDVIEAHEEGSVYVHEIGCDFEPNDTQVSLPIFVHNFVLKDTTRRRTTALETIVDAYFKTHLDLCKSKVH